MADRRRVAIVGAGLSGLTAAYRLDRLAAENDPDAQITLFEATHRAGGAVHTHTDDGCVLELGADSFITNKPDAIDLCRELGMEDQLLPTNAENRRSLVLCRGVPQPVPRGFQLLAPSDVEAVLDSEILSTAGKQRFLQEEDIPSREDDVEESLAEFTRRRFGTEVFERLVQPLVGGIYTADPEKLSLAATMPRFLAMERNHGSLIRAMREQQREVVEASGARYSLFLTLRDGLGSLVASLRAAFSSRVSLLSESVATSVSPATSGLRVSQSQITDSFDAVLLAIPAWRAADILCGGCTPLSEELAEIPYASSVVVGTTHSDTDFAEKLDAFGLVIPAIEQRDVLAVSFASRKFPGRARAGEITLRTFLGGALQPEMPTRPDAEIESIVSAELESLLGMKRPPKRTVVARWNRAMPQYHIGHITRVEKIERLAANVPGLFLAGNAYRGVGIPDVIASGNRAANACWEFLCG